MKGFFLRKETLVKMALALLIGVNLLPWRIAALLALALGAALFLLRKNQVFHQDNYSLNPDLVLAPANGVVTKVSKTKDDGKSKPSVLIEVRMPFEGPYGLYLPFESEIQEDQTEGGSRFTKRPNRYNLSLLSKGGERVGLSLGQGRFGSAPRLYARSGDRGSPLACFGYFPYGGSLDITLPEGAQVMVAQGDKLKAGETAIAGF